VFVLTLETALYADVTGSFCINAFVQIKPIFF
jgi:hypothetical protein